MNLFGESTEDPVIPQRIPLRDYQEFCSRKTREEMQNFQRILNVMSTGCHAAGTEILMADGRLKKVEEISVGDFVMGWDSTPRRVLELHRGVDEMVNIVPKKGAVFTVNKGHILSLIQTNTSSNRKDSNTSGRVVDVSVEGYRQWGKTQKHIHKLFRAPVASFHADKEDLKVSPYFMGVFLGDGCFRSDMIDVIKPNPEIGIAVKEEAERWGAKYAYLPQPERCDVHGIRECKPLRLELFRLGLRGVRSGTKFIPAQYKTSSFRDRLEILAGILDTDGAVSKSGYDYISKSEKLAHDVTFVARSVGLAAYINKCKKGCQNGFTGEYFRVSITGNCDKIPCRIKKAPKRRQVKDVLRTGFSIEPADMSEYFGCEYFGFTIEGDGRYLMGDFTVTHNSGKTMIFADLIRQTIPYRSIVLVNRDELVQQACDKIQKALGFHAEIEKAESYADLNAPVVVASVQTLRGKRLERWPQNHFALCISDEAHLSLAPTWLKIMKYFDPYAKIVGFTATPERGDRKNLGEYYETMACEIGLVPLIKQGWLSKLVIKTIPVKIDVSSAKIGSDGDLDAKDVSETLTPYFTQICREIKTHAHGRKILTFLPLVDTSKTFVKVCQAQGINARHVDGESEDRKQILQDYRDNKFELLSNVNLLLAGYDCWDIDCIIPLRPTRSQSVYAQAVGRGTRTPPGVDNFKTPEERLAFIAQSSKKNCLLIDFLWAHERHSLIRPANLVASSKEVAEEMTSMLEAQALGGEAVEELRRRGKNIDPDEIEAEADLITVEAAAVRQREKALLSQIKKSAKKNAKTVSILELAQLTQDARPLDYQETFPWHSLPVTPAQEQALTNCGIDASDVKDRGQASHLLSIVEERIKSGLPSVAQIKYAKRLGHASPEKLTFDEISKYIESRKAQRTMG